MARLPLPVIPLILFNIGLFALSEPGFATELFSLSMMSGGVWAMTIADALVVIALIVLFFEIMKSTGIGRSAVLDHLLSTLVFIVYLVEFLLVSGAATSLFFTLMVIALIDVMAGFSVTIRAAQRDVSFE